MGKSCVLLILVLVFVVSCNERFSVVKAQSKPVNLKTKISLFGSGANNVTSGVTFPSANNTGGGSGYFCDVSFNSSTKILYSSVHANGVWVYNTTTGSGSVINNTTTGFGGEHQVTGDIFPDITGPKYVRCLDSSGDYLVVGINFSEIWVLNTKTMIAKSYFPSDAGSAGGDVIPTLTYSSPHIYGNKLFADLRGSGVWILDLTSNISTLLSNSTTDGGIHAVTGDPFYSSNISQVGIVYDPAKNLFYGGGEGQGSWFYDMTAGSAKMLTTANTSAGQSYEINGDALPEDEMYYHKSGFVNNVTVGSTWSNGTYIYNIGTNTGISLTTTTTQVGGTHEVTGDPMPHNDSIGFEWDSSKGVIFYAMRSVSGIWIYNMNTKKGTHLLTDDFGQTIPSNSWALSYDKAKQTLYAKLGSNQIVKIEIADELLK